MKVFLDYDQQGLDDAYDQFVYAANANQVIRRYAQNSDFVRQRLGEPQRLAYGSSEFEKLDVYRTSVAKAPVNVYIHGGAWRRRSARDYGYPAEMFVLAGAHYVVPDFISVDDSGGGLDTMANQVRAALAWTYENCSEFGADPARLYISGSSSGAHLGGVLATYDWQKEFGLPRDLVKGYVLVSGMYDLRGPRLSKRSSYVRFTDEIEAALSPARHAHKASAPIVLVYGSLETPEFQRQSREFADALAKAGKSVRLVCAAGYNHFEIAETIANPLGPVGRAVLDQMSLSLRPPSEKKESTDERSD